MTKKTFGILLLISMILNACVTDNSKPILKSERISYKELPTSYADGFYYEVVLYTSQTYQGDPMQHIKLLNQDSIIFSDVWAESGPCFSKGESYGPMWAFIIKSPNDYGDFIMTRDGYKQPWFKRIIDKIEILPFSNLDSSFCDSGRVITQYWYGK